MNSENITYYLLTLKGNASASAKSGDAFEGSTQPLLIGETAECDIQYKPRANHAPECFAAILPNEDGESWRIVSMSRDVTIDVSGQGHVPYTCHLTSGDQIRFSGHKASLTFRVKHDANFGRGVRKTDNRVAYFLFAFLFLVIAAVAFALYSSLHKIDENDLQAYKESVFTIRVDSVDCAYVVAATGDTVVTWRDPFSDGRQMVGTAFLTVDSQLITARHCVEYWLAEQVTPATKLADYDPQSIVPIVAAAETYNYTRETDDTTYLMRSYCSVFPHGDVTAAPILRFVSTDANVSIPKHNDGMLTLENGDEVAYWRTLTPFFSNRSMEAGDIVSVKCALPGNIVLADSATVRGMAAGEEMALLGYPESDTKAGFKFSNGRFERSITDSRDWSMIVFEGDAYHGNSGSPLFVSNGLKGYQVVGVMSRIDKKNQSLKYAVPIYSITNGEIDK